jgi:hypothetical protein
VRLRGCWATESDGNAAQTHVFLIERRDLLLLLLLPLLLLLLLLLHSTRYIKSNNIVPIFNLFLSVKRFIGKTVCVFQYFG